MITLFIDAESRLFKNITASGIIKFLLKDLEPNSKQ